MRDQRAGGFRLPQASNPFHGFSCFIMPDGLGRRPKHPRCRTPLSRFSPSRSHQRRGTALGLEHPVFSRLEQLKTNHPSHVLVVLFDPDDPHQRNETLRSGQLEGGPDLDLPLGRETASIASNIGGFDVVFELGTVLIPARHFEPYLEVDALGSSRNEVFDRRLLSLHEFMGNCWNGESSCVS